MKKYIFFALFLSACTAKTELAFKNKELIIRKGETQKLELLKSVENLRWQSEKPNLVSVEKGEIKALNVGKTKIFVFSENDTSAKVFVEILVNDPLSDELFKPSDLTSPNLFTEGIEGPAFYEGFLYAVNFEKNGTIGKINPNTGESELFVNLPEGSIGNGIRFNSKGEMLVADYKKHNILKVDMKSKKVSVFANENNMVGNSPNDIAVASNDVIYASAPNWNDNTGSLWKIDQNGKVFLLEKNMGTTNGIEVSPKDDFLYVNESVQRKVWKYNLSPDGKISNKKLLIAFEDHGFDGMRCDKEGNLYICRYGAGEVVKVSPEGKILQSIKLIGKNVSNITFGGKDGKICYLTLQDRGSVEVFRVDIAGK